MILDRMHYFAAKDDTENLVQQLRVQWNSDEMTPMASSSTDVQGTITVSSRDQYLVVEVATYVNGSSYYKAPIYVKKYGAVDVPFVVEEDEAYTVDGSYYMVEEVVTVNDIYFYIINTNGVFCILNGPVADSHKSISLNIWPFNIVIPTQTTQYTDIYPVVSAGALTAMLEGDDIKNKSRDEVKEFLTEHLTPTARTFSGGDGFVDSEDAIFKVTGSSVSLDNPAYSSVDLEESKNYIRYINGKQLTAGSLYFTFNLKDVTNGDTNE